MREGQERKKEGKKEKRKERLQYSLSLCETLLVHTLQVCHLDPCTSLSPWPSAISNPSFFLPIDNFQTPALSLASGEGFEVPTPSNIWLLTSFFPGFNAHVFFFSLVSALQHELRVT